MEECKLREVITPIVDINKRKNDILEKIRKNRKLSILRKALFSLKNNSNNNFVSIEDNIALNYNYIFEDITTMNYSQHLCDIVHITVNWWKQQLIIPEIENASDNDSLKLFCEYLSKIVLYEVYNKGNCELTTDAINDNEPLMVAKYLSGIDWQFIGYSSMYIDKEGSTLGTNPVDCDYSVYRNRK